MSKNRLGKAERARLKAARRERNRLVAENMAKPIAKVAPLANSMTRLEGGYPIFRDPHGSYDNTYVRGERGDLSRPSFVDKQQKRFS